MAFTFEEVPASRSSSLDPPSKTLVFKAVGEFDDGIVENYAYNNAPGFLATAAGVLYPQNFELEPDGWAQYLVTVRYGKPDLLVQTSQSGAMTWSFDTTGATTHITTAKEHIASFPAGAPTDPHKGNIGVGLDGSIDGTDIIIPALKLTYTFRHPAAFLTESQAIALARNTGKVNSVSFRGFAAGELLFLGATGSDGSESDAEVSYQFAASENVTDLSFGDITSIVKAGHHYAWVEHEENVDTGQHISKPKRVHVERVYSTVNFSSVLGWA